MVIVYGLSLALGIYFVLFNAAYAFLVQPDLSMIENTLPSCCDHNISTADLLLRANTSASYNIPRPVQFGPGIQVGLVSYATKNIWKYASYAMAINAAYAEYNGYSLTILDESSGSFEDMDSRWNKVAILERALHPIHGWARDMDYLVWIDADFVFLDFSFRLESVVSEALNPKAHIFISAEHAGSSTLINSGCILVRNTNWARTFLSEWWDFADRRLFSDQEQFDLVYENRRKAAAALGDERLFIDHIAILPPDKLNSDPPAMIQQKAHNQVLHLMGEESQYRVRVFQAGLAELCRHHSAVRNIKLNRSNQILQVQEDGSSVEAVVPVQDPDSSAVHLAPQLTLTQSNLLFWAVQEYSQHSQQLLSEYEAALPAVSTLAPSYTGPVPVHTRPQDLQTSQRLANAVHHYAHANLHFSDQQQQHFQEQRKGHRQEQEQEQEEDHMHKNQAVVKESMSAQDNRRREGILLRKKVYQLLRRNLVAWKKLKNHPPSERFSNSPPKGTVVTFEQIRQDWPELLKISAIAGQHLLSVTDSDLVSMKERRHVAGEILSMMEEMMAESHTAQHDAILLMVADIHSQIGLLDQLESNAMVSIASRGVIADDSATLTVEEEDKHIKQEKQVEKAELFARAALQHFQLSLDITRRIADKSGKHILVAPLTLTANALASLLQYDTAFEMYEQALQLNAAHFGATHSSNIALLVDFGISLVHAVSHKKHEMVEVDRLCEQANAVLQKARKLMHLEEMDKSGHFFQRVLEYQMKTDVLCGL